MRPNKLIMSAFGPYADRVEVNLKELGENGLYLITGDTGAGKTTIFDAITYALFGKASGENRESSMFRSKYAKPETPTEVELYFTCKGKEYHIKRNPEYERPKSRGEGTTAEKANAELNFPDGRVITRQKEVDNAVVEIIGVDRNQFTQIAMIAQGDFLKLLLAPTDERKKIFQKLFKTDKFSQLQERLKTGSGKLCREYDGIKSSIEQYIQGILCDEDDVLSIEVKKAKEGNIPVAEIIEVLEQLICRDSDTEKNYDKEIKAAEQGLEKITGILTKAQTLQTAKESLEKSEAELEAILALKPGLSESLKLWENRVGESDEIIKKIAAIDAELQGYNELDSKKKELSGLAVEVKAYEEGLGLKKEEQKNLEKIISELEKELEKLGSIGADKAKLEGELKELKDKKKELDGFEKETEILLKLKSELKSAQEAYREKSEFSSAKAREYENMNRAYLDEQAGVLAEFLEDGAPCPVCGSLSHPAPAQKSQIAPTEQELEKAKTVLEKAQKEEREASVTAGQLKGVADEKESALNKLSKELLRDMSLEDKKTEINGEISALEDKLKKIAGDEKRRDETGKRLPKERERLEALKKDVSELGENIVKNKTVIKTLEARISELTKKLMFASELDAEKEKFELNERRHEIETGFKLAKDKYDDNEKLITELLGRIEENKKILRDSEEIDKASEEKKQEELKARKEELLKMQKDVHSRMSANSMFLENIKQKSDEIKRVEERLRWVKALSDTANGNLSGKEKIMLETYIQMTYFERIIERANTRLLVMTGGQYELKRRREAENNRSQSGLELDVIDHYNGTERSIKTLSGGESFKASLSLALGLSDEIQSSAGGIRLDTMFVDEGFGSLDDESLSQAIKALSLLADGNRLVGIISHVNDLKDRIDKQIIVTKEKSGGSKIFLHI